MPDIHDVIGSLRGYYLEMGNKIHALNLAVALLEARVERLDKTLAPQGVQDTQSTLEDPDGNSIDSLPRPTPRPTPAPRVGQKRSGRKPNSGDVHS